jgi:hypothetical protein
MAGLIIRRCRIHHIGPSSNTNQHHGLYLQNVSGALIENNWLYGCKGGYAIQIWSTTASGSGGAVSNNTIRQNTIWGNHGAFIIGAAASCVASSNVLSRNIIAGQDPGLTAYNSGGDTFTGTNPSLKYGAITDTWGGTGSGNALLDNVFFANKTANWSDGSATASDATGAYWTSLAYARWTHANNAAVLAANPRRSLDPQFVNAAGGDFTVQNVRLLGYGAPGAIAGDGRLQRGWMERS